MYRKELKTLGLCIGVMAICLAAPTAWGDIGGSSMTLLAPDPIPAGSFSMCFTVNVQSPDLEYMDVFAIDLPDGWTVDVVAPDSVPPANGCAGALPPVVGVDPGNDVYWQSQGAIPTGCGAWNGGAAPGTDFDFCIDVTVPDGTGAPWSFPWDIIGDGWGGVPHATGGTYGPVDYAGGGAPPNDECDGALVLNPGQCVVVTNDRATNSGPPDPSCANFAGGDIWVEITLPAGQWVDEVFTQNGVGVTDTGMSYYAECPHVTEIQCDDDGGAGLFSLVGPVNGPGTFYVRTWEYGNDAIGEWEVCATELVPVELMSIEVE